MLIHSKQIQEKIIDLNPFSLESGEKPFLNSLKYDRDGVSDQAHAKKFLFRHDGLPATLRQLDS